MKVDFHLHSTASDGSLAPSGVARLAAEGEYRWVALTDHDCTDGVAEFVKAESAVNAVAGVELSVDAGAGFDTFHLLGLGIDPAAATLAGFLRDVRVARDERNAVMRENFRKIGIEIPAEELAAEAGGAVVARPHFAKWLVRHGYAADVAAAFAKYLLADSPAETRCYASRRRPSQERAIAVVHGAGGLAVMAHPRLWRRAWKRGGVEWDAVRGAVPALKEKGLDGLEAIYRGNTSEETVGFVRVARENGLVVSAGSDFHGSAKPDVPFGMEAADEVIGPLVERLSSFQLKGDNKS